jgi:histidinol-phosphatase (PHP family)
MAWSNYHSHTIFSDGSDEPAKYVEEAIAQGMDGYGFSCHAPVPFETNWSMKKENTDLYFEEISKLKKENVSILKIFASLEIDYIPGMISPADKFLDRYPLDYRIGSIHFVEAFENGYPWGIDGTAELFAEGILKIWKNDAKRAVQKYFRLLREMIAMAKPDIIGHFDKIRMHNEENRYFSEEADWYRMEIMESLELMRNTNCLAEVNTRGMYRGNKKEPYPSFWILKEMEKLGIPIVLNSDAHKPNEITGYFKEVSLLLKDCGYTELHFFNEGKWEPKPFNENGLIL